MGLTVVGVVTTKYGDDALVKIVNEVVAHGNKKANVLAEGANCIHNPLVVRKDRGGDKGTITILVGLTKMLKCSMGLVVIAGANFMEDQAQIFSQASCWILSSISRLISNASVFAEGRLKLDALRKMGLFCMQARICSWTLAGLRVQRSLRPA
jgi:hypothetical protein